MQDFLVAYMETMFLLPSKTSIKILSNELELICFCGHKLGWHHGKNEDKTLTKCYGIGCPCTKFEHNLCCLVPIFEKLLLNKSEQLK